MIQFNCSCGQTLTTSDQNAGKTVTCTRCGEWVAVPGEAAEPAPRAAVPSYPGVYMEEKSPPRRPRAPAAPYRDEGSRGNQPATSGRAVTSLILGLISFCLPILLSIPAIIFGFIGLADAGRGKAGKGLAITGLLTGFLSLVLGLVVIAGAVYFANFVLPEMHARMQNDVNLKGLVKAMHYYHDSNRKLPQHAIYSKSDQKPLLSWRVQLLPYVNEQNLYQQFNLNEPWDSPTNKPLLTKMPKIYAHRLDRQGTKDGITYFQVFVADFGTPFPKGPHNYKTLQGISDGSSNTILIVEAAKGVPWTAPDDIMFSPNLPLPELGLSASHFQAAFADGTTMILQKKGLDEAALRGAITADGGEVIFLKK